MSMNIKDIFVVAAVVASTAVVGDEDYSVNYIECNYSELDQTYTLSAQIRKPQGRNLT